MLGAMFEVEKTSLPSEPIMEEDVLSASVQTTTVDVEEGSDDGGLKVTSSSTRGSSVCRFVRATEQMSEELQLLIAESHDMGGGGRGLSLHHVVDEEMRSARDLLPSSRRQTQITDFSDPMNCESLTV